MNTNPAPTPQPISAAGLTAPKGKPAATPRAATPARRISASGLTVPKRKASLPEGIPIAPNAAPTRISAAGLAVPTIKIIHEPPAACEPIRTQAERVALFNRLRTLRDSLIADGVNKNDLAIALIAACISGGLCTGRNIVAALDHLGRNARHAGMVLSKSTGILWQKGSKGRYRLLR